MLYVYSVAYYCGDYIINSIHSLRNATGDPFNLTLCENESINSPVIRELLREEVDIGNVDTSIMFKGNLLSSSLRYAYMLNPPKNDSEDFVVFTDLDLKVPHGIDWIDELKMRLAHPEVGLVAFDLDPINYLTPLRARVYALTSRVTDLLPSKFGLLSRVLLNARFLGGPNRGHIPADHRTLDAKYHIYTNLPSGMWLCGVRKDIVDKFIHRYDTFLDKHLNSFTRSLGFVVGRLPTKLYHYGWDAWKDYPDYYVHKLFILHEFHTESRQLCGYEVFRRKQVDRAQGSR
jgi:hypothetical protein